MLSTPPAMNASPSSALIAWAARGDRLQTGPAQPIDGLSGDVDRKAGQQRRHAGDVAVVFTRLVRAAEDHIVKRGRIESRPARPTRLTTMAARSSGRIVGEGAADAADRRPHRGNDERVSHGSP